MSVELKIRIEKTMMVWCGGVEREASWEEIMTCFPYAPKEPCVWEGSIYNSMDNVCKDIPCDIGIPSQTTPTLYDCVWGGDGKTCVDLMPLLMSAIIYMKENRQALANKHRIPFDSLLSFVSRFLWACYTSPSDAVVRTDR